MHNMEHLKRKMKKAAAEKEKETKEAEKAGGIIINMVPCKINWPKRG